MARYGKDSKLNPEKVLQRAVAFFGLDGLGLEPKESSAGCALFEGGGGYVSVYACEKGRGSTVEVETREWDHQVQDFLHQI